MQLLISACRFRSWLSPLAASTLVFLFALPHRLSGQVTADVAEARPPLPVFTSAREAVATVTERGAHHRVEQWVERIIGEDGTTNDVTHSATVLANGMHYLDGGEWRETVPEFVAVNGGWLAARGPHQVLVSEELFVAGAVTVVSPEGQTWKSTPMTLALRDRASGQVWVLGESRATRGELVAANTVLFRDAFAGDAGLRADVRVVTSAGGVECDVIVRSGVPTREALGEAGTAAELVVLTEVFEPGGATANPVDRGGRSDDVVRLGALTMDQGQAFGTDLPGTPDRYVPVFKRVYQDEPSGRVFLEEATPLDSLAPLLEALPEVRVPGPLEARWRRTAGGAVLPVRREGVLPGPTFPRRADGRFEVAASGTDRRTFAAVKATPGVVLDWQMLNSATNFTFRGDTTYRVTNAVTLSGTNVTFEGGTVIKFDAGVNGSVSIASGVNFNWQAEPFRPVTFTAKDDDSLGDKITGSTGNPSGAYAATALFLNGTSRTNGLVLTNLRVRHASVGINPFYFYTNCPFTLRHAQFVSCTYPFKLQRGNAGATSFFLQNILVAGADTLFKDGDTAGILAHFLTVHGATNWFASVYSPHHCTLTVADSILCAVGSVNVGTTDHCWVASSASGLFASAGAGHHYLDTSGPAYAIDSKADAETLIPDYTQFTPNPPPYLTSPVMTPTVPGLGVGFPGNWKLGYHYPLVNWLADNVTVSAPLVLTNRTVIGLVGTKGFQLNAGASIIAGGQPGAPVRLVRVSLVQEGTNGLTGSSFKVFEAATASPPPTVEARFAEFLLPNDPAGRRVLLNDSANAVFSFSLRDCRVTGGTLTFSPPTPSVSQVVTLFNNVFEGAGLYFYRYYDNNLTVSFRHNLVRYGDCWASYYPQTYQNPYWTFKDNLFESASLLNTAGTYLLGGFNGYTAATATFGGSGNKTSLVPDYVAGPIGRYCYPTTGASSSLTNLIDAGSGSGGAAGLYHHTTLVAGTKETNGPVDIGFHYASPPVDTDGDGLADCLEDTDGDGVTDDGETSLTAYDTDGDGVNDLAEPAGQVVSFGQTWGIGDATANVGTGTSYVAIAAGVGHNLAVRESGQVVGWGSNAYGQTNTPPAATNAVAVAGGERHSLALAETGVVRAWGDNTWHQITVPAPNTNFTAVAAGYRHSLALKNDGTVRAWGDNGYGQSTVPGGLANVLQVAGGQEHSLALKADGTVVGWGRNQHGQTTAPPSATGVVEIAAGWTHSLALKSDGTVVAWGDSTAGATTVPTGLTNALHIAAGQNFSVALRNDGTLLAWGSNTSGQTTIPAGLTNVQSIACGQARVVTLPYSPVLSYPVDVRRDLLVIYNTNTAASVGITDHYRTNRPHAAKANYLGLGMHTNYTHTTLFDNTQAPAMLFNPVLQWYTNHPTLRPRYILFSWGVPVWWTNTAPSGWSGAGGSSQNILRESVPGKKPFLGALNLETTNDVAAYIGKLTSFGVSSPPLRVVLSASKTGYGNRVFAFNNYYGLDFGSISYMPEAVTALANNGLAGTNIYYVFGRSDGISAGCGYHSGQTPLTGVTNPAAFTTWGVYACQGKDWSSNGAITFSGDAAWYLLQAYESWNANWGTEPAKTAQAKYTQWFKATAFGGSNYSRTPVGAMSHVAEPKLSGANNSATWNALWHLGKSLGISTWTAKDAATDPNNYSFHDQTTGDPLVSK